MTTGAGLPSKRWAMVFAAENYISIIPQSGATGRNGDPSLGFVFFAPDAPDAEIGAALLQALAKSRFLDLAMQQMVDYEIAADDAWYEHVLAQYGYEHRQEAAEASRSCEVTLENGVITLAPVGKSEDEIEWLDEIDVAETARPDQIGAAVKLAIRRAFDWQGDWSSA